MENFLEELKAIDIVNACKKIHYKCREYLDNRNFDGMKDFLELFNHKDVDVNYLKTILVITQSFRENEILKRQLAEIKILFDNLVHS